MMNRKKWTGVSVALLIALVFLCAGCRKTAPPSETPSIPSSVGSSLPPDDDSAPSGESSSETSSLDSSSAGSSSEESSSVPGGAYREADFKKAFDGNPIDKASDSEQGDAATTSEMVSVAGKFAQIWETEVGIANKKAAQSLSGSALTAYKADQSAWSGKKEAALNKLRKDIMDEGGSIAALEISLQTADFYRSRVYQIYLAVYLETGKLPKLTYNGEND